MVSGEENDAGRPGRHDELSFFVGPSFTLARAKKTPIKFRLQPYFAAGLGVVSQGLETSTVQLTDPSCNPALGPCGFIQTEDTTWDRANYPLLGGGLRLDMASAFIDLGATFSPIDPRGTVGVGFTFGLRLGPR